MNIVMTKLNKYTLFGSAIFGILTLILGIVMLFTFPIDADLSEGFQTPIIAFEFAKTEADLSFLSGDSELNKQNREKMDAGHVWDMGFPFFYGGFIILMLLHVSKNNHRFIWLGLVCAASIIPFDINENLTLLQITKALGNSASIENLLLELHIATWLKWGAIGFSIAVLAAGFAASKEYFSAVFSMLSPLGVAICWASDSHPSLTEAMSIIIFLFFAVFTIKACIQSWTVIRTKSDSRVI
jgi:hypothetical protein